MLRRAARESLYAMTKSTDAMGGGGNNTSTQKRKKESENVKTTARFFPHGPFRKFGPNCKQAAMRKFYTS